MYSPPRFLTGLLKKLSPGRKSYHRIVGEWDATTEENNTPKNVMQQYCLMNLRSCSLGKNVSIHVALRTAMTIKSYKVEPNRSLMRRNLSWTCKISQARRIMLTLMSRNKITSFFEEGHIMKNVFDQVNKGMPYDHHLSDQT